MRNKKYIYTLVNDYPLYYKKIVSNLCVIGSAFQSSMLTPCYSCYACKFCSYLLIAALNV